jgi:putative transposase
MPSVKRSYKYRLYPTPGQAVELGRTFGCVRLVYNKALDARTAAWYREQRRMTYVETSAMLTVWKRTQELAFLNEVSCVPLQQTLRHLQDAFVSFWEGRARYPRFKAKKRHRDAAEFTRSAFRYRDGQLTLAKMAEPLAIRWSRPLPAGAQPSTVTISRDPAGRWFVSLQLAETIPPLPPTNGQVGLDAGLTSLVTLSTGDKLANPRHERRSRARLTHAQRSLARKRPGSANRSKARRRVARIHARIADRRRDHLHKLSTRLVRENQTVVIEDLGVRGMTANHSLARAISDAGWADLRRMLAYKAAWYGRELVVIDRWYPSSTTCSGCGDLAGTLPLSVRAWTCQGCGSRHDRDVNAAKNILAAGLAAAACGAGVGPQREASRTRRPAEKQEPQRATAGLSAPLGRGEEVKGPSVVEP